MSIVPPIYTVHFPLQLYELREKLDLPRVLFKVQCQVHN